MDKADQIPLFNQIIREFMNEWTPKIVEDQIKSTPGDYRWES